MSELGPGCVWQGGRGMRIMTVALALGTALVLCNLGTFNAAAHAREAKVVREPRVRLIVRVPVVVRPTPWDLPVISYGPQEETVPLWLANALGLGRVHGRDWPCKGQSR